MALKVFTSRPMLKGPQGIASMQEVFRLTSKGLGKIVKPDDIHPRRSERPAHSRQASSSSYNMHHRRGRSPMPRVSGTSKLYWKTAVRHCKDEHRLKPGRAYTSRKDCRSKALQFAIQHRSW
ncbi:hypothetical protein PMIN07_000593 [Paraphaeosphaeria minitans]